MAIDLQIQEQLEMLARRQRRVDLWRNLAWIWAAAALLGGVIWFVEKRGGWNSPLMLPLVGLLALGTAIVFMIGRRNTQPARLEIARRIERLHPELQGRLVTALEQQPGGDGRLNYLQQRVILETLEHSRAVDWAQAVPARTLRLAQAAQWLALVLLGVALLGLRGGDAQHASSRAQNIDGISVTPGDVNLERGSSLVILARFKGVLPASVDLVLGQSAQLQRVSLVKALGDAMFGGSIPDVASNFVYHVEYGGRRTRDFNVSVYEHPRLERADVELTFPGYTRLPNKRIENTRRLSAVEGSQLDLALRFNKPVSSARLVARDNDHTSVPLAVDTNNPAATLKQFQLDSSKTYDLQLVDAEGRTNKVPSEFVFEALKNRPPEIRLTLPQGDIRPSPLEEIPFEGTVWDDFGVEAFGIAYAVNGQAPKFIELGKGVPGNEKKPFRHVLRLEDIGVQPDQLVSWFVWSDDLGPDGKVRRTMGDLFFGEVRPFEEVFREGQGMEGQASQGESGGEDKTGRLADLEKQIVNATWKLQRDHGGSSTRVPSMQDKVTPRKSAAQPGDQSRNESVFPATDRSLPFLSRRYFVAGQISRENSSDSPNGADELSRSDNRKRAQSAGNSHPPKYEDDAVVVLDSQAQALEQAKEALQKQRDPQAAGLWQKAVTDMETAVARLQQATNSPAALKDALAAEQQAYQAIIRLQAHEYQVSRSRNRSQSGSGRNQQMQRQLEELDLADQDKRYENQREAQRAQNPERREQLQIMSRLQELARRQQDLNQRLKELQTALQEARTEQERAEIRRQLKRLQEEEQQMLADVDEVKQRMDQPNNQSQLAQERRQLDQTRQEVQRAGEAAGQGAASQALAAGTRAQNQLQQLRDDLRKKSSSQFAEDLRQMRSQARELARNQEDILKKIQEGTPADRKSLSGAADQEQTRAQLARQKELMTNLVERATQISQQAEEAEPLLSHQLYDAVRKFTQDTAKDLKEAQTDLLNRGPMTRSLFDMLRDNSEQGAAKLEDITSELLRLGFVPQAGRIGERARPGIDNLKKGLEHAAESVLGDDAEDLRLAQRQLDELTRQLGNEIADAQGGSLQTNGSRSGTEPGSAGQPPGAGQPGTNAAAQLQASNQGQSQSQQSRPTGQNQPGSQPGAAQDGSASEDAQTQASSQQPGQAPGGQPNSDGNKPGDAPGANALAGQGRGPQSGGQNRGARQAAQGGGANGGDPTDANAAAGAGGGARNWDRLLSENVRRQNAPITGEDFNSWSDRLREVEQLIDEPGLRDEVSKARERARLVRQEFKTDRKKPDWAVVQLQVMHPLNEVRDRIADELARRESREALVPLDRDPVPNRYSELVRRYYEGLGKDK